MLKHLLIPCLSLGAALGLSAVEVPVIEADRLLQPLDTDYTITLDYDEINPADHVARYTITAGADVASVKYYVSYGLMTDRDLKSKIKSEGKILDLSADSYTIDLEREGYYQLYITAYDSGGNITATAGTTFYRFDDNNDNWISLGITTITESFTGSMWNGIDPASSAYGVEIQKHATKDGIFRLVNPYVPLTGTAHHPKSEPITGKNHYIYLDATNPKAVFFYETPIGSYENNSGELVVSSYAYYMMSHYGWGMDLATSSNRVGTFENGIILFPEYATVQWVDRYQNSTVHFGGEFIIPVPIEHTVTVAAAKEGLGTVAIIDPATEGASITTKEPRVTISATPAEGCGFIEWRDASGKVVSTDPEYTYLGTADAAFTAVFGYNMNIVTNGNGVSTLKTAAGASVYDGDIVLPDTKLILTVNTIDEYVILDIDINGTNFNYSPVEFTVDQPTAITVNILDKLFKLAVNITGDGEVQVFTKGSDSEAPIAENVLMPGADVPKGTPVRIFASPAEGMKIVAASVIPGNGSDTPSAINISRATQCSWDASWYYLRGASTHQSKGDYVVNVEFGTSASAIDTIDADHAEGVYYNLQGMPVPAENLTTGFYILRQADKTSKVYIVR